MATKKREEEPIVPVKQPKVAPVPLSVKLSPAVVQRIDRIAGETGQSRHATILFLVESALAAAEAQLNRK